jgi:acetoin utilization deacetylase AcuC-like enzyme
MRTGLVWDERFLLHRAPPGHPEHEGRAEAIRDRFEADGLAGRCERVDARPATRHELLAVHTPGLLDEVGATATRSYSQLDPDTYARPESEEAALLAAGGLVDLTAGVLDGSLQGGFALVRPPGHHAEADRAMGFCLFNNVAVAAKAALSRGARRVLVVDWDVHHGNGTQHTFWDDPDVLYFSTHQYPFYPGTGSILETGGPKAPGRTVNVPWPGGMGDAEYLAAFDRVLLPIARAFAPDIILVSAGFDAAEGDLLGNMGITPAGYAAMTARLAELADGKVVLALEGGYNLEAISASAAACLRVLLGERPRQADLGQPSPLASRILAEVARVQSPFWPGALGRGSPKAT